MFSILSANVQPDLGRNECVIVLVTAFSFAEISCCLCLIICVYVYDANLDNVNARVW